MAVARTATEISAEIAVLEARLASVHSLARSVNSRGTGITNESRKDMQERLDALYAQLGRVNGTAPMFARGIVTGLRT